MSEKHIKKWQMGKQVVKQHMISCCDNYLQQVFGKEIYRLD